MKRQAWILVVLGVITATSAVPAWCFDLIVPARARMKVDDIYAITTANWGWVVATTETLFCADLPQSNTPATDDHPQLGFFTSAFNGCQNYAPVPPGGVIGYQGDQTPVLTPFLNPGEFFVAPGQTEPALGVFDCDDVTNVTVTVVAHYDIAGQRAEYTTVIEFVSTPVNNRLEILEGQRVSSVPIEPTAADAGSWGQLKIRFAQHD